MKRDASGKFVSNWKEEIKQRVSLSLTNTAWRSLDEAAHKRGISRSEMIEFIARSFGDEADPDDNCFRCITQPEAIANLQRQKQDLEALLDNAPDAIARFDAQIRYLYVNRVVEEVLGCSRDVLLGKSLAEVISDPIYRFWEEHLRLVFATAQQQEIEFEFTTPFGIRFYQARLVPELDSEGTPISVVVISRDITASREAQQQHSQLFAAQETERQVTTILESITDAFVAFDSNWRYTYVNQAAAKILQKTPDEILGKHVWLEVFPELVGSISYQEIHRAVAEQVPVSWEEFGEPVQCWIEVHAYPSAEGVAIYFRDITQRKQAQAEQERLLQELETERKRFEAVLRQMPAGVMIADAASGKLVLTNEQAKQILGYGYEQSLELEEYELIVPFTALRGNGEIYATNEYPLVRSLLRGEAIANEEIELHHSDGSHIFITVNSAPIRNQQNQIVAAVTVFQDITARKQAEAKLRQQAEILTNQQRWLETVLDLMPTPMVFIEPETAKITFANRMANELAGGDLAKHKSVGEYPQASYCTDDNGVRIPTARMPAVLIAQGERLQNYQVNWHSSKGIRATLCWGETLPAMYGHPAIGICMFQDVTRLKEIEDNQRHTEERLQLALSSAQIIAWDIDLLANHVVCSPNAVDVWGIQAGTVEGFFAIIHPDDRPQVIQTVQRAIAGEPIYNLEYRVITPDGAIRWYNGQGQVYRDQTGRAIRMTGVSVEITQRKQAEQERELAQRQLTTIFETSPVGIALLDGQQRYIAINQALATINGLKREQHFGRSIAEVFGESDANIVEIFHSIYTTGNPFICPNLAINVPARSDRSPGYYNVYYLPTKTSTHQVEQVLAYVLDVTEQVKLEHGQRFLSQASAVLASSLDYQTTLEQVAQLIVPELADWCTIHMVTEDGGIEQIAIAHTDPAKLEWAHQINEKYPLNPEEPRGAALTLRTGRSDFLTDIPDELLVQAARDSEHLEILREVGFKSVMTVPLRTQTRIFGVISFIAAESGKQYDQSHLQLAEELAHRASLAIDNAQLYRTAQRDRAKAEAANRIKDEFLAVLSHELRSPLNPILGWTRMLRTQRLNPTKVNLALETIERNAQLQAQLIEDLLDVSRILQGKITLNIAPVNLVATIEAATETVRLAAAAKSIQIQTKINQITGSVAGDSNRLQQIVWNLISNAVKFTPSGGRIEVKLEQVDMYAQIQVKDTGTGISREFLPHVFEYFRQEDGTSTRKFGGLGLGLAIVRHLTELHGGTVHAESLGQNLGATFTVRLPLNPIAQKLSGGSSHSLPTNLTDIQILVVDDDRDMRELAAFILTQAGAHVTTAACATQALSMLNQSLPDLLLCDIGMPDTDGYSLMRQIRKCSPEQGGTIKAIALTAYAGEINQQQALAAGFQIHITKPIDPDELVQTIVQLLNRDR
ncbi:PAS/PAC sensor hybrid histidine kinase [Calothrix sp. NIES-2100]|uniref:PAS domain-containing protein n=1 Tax=Calothrix sp. NIES-2100 TaxID=1954172 RepID=UPI000B5E136B|nr:PAS/PAC sensor hybrid histidine kinase [Calothrix sp. NIES-2100]